MEVGDQGVHDLEMVAGVDEDFGPAASCFQDTVFVRGGFQGSAAGVIGHRMGKGQAVARGVEKAGGKAIVIPGMAADMKLGDVMKENNADLGISFCGSGGAGALTAQNKSSSFQYLFRIS